MASILDEYEDSQNTRKSAQQHSRLSNTNIGIPHTGEPPLLPMSPVLCFRRRYGYKNIITLLKSDTDSVPFLGFVNVRLEEEKPIFNKQRVEFTPPEKINYLVVCNNQLCMNLGKDTLLR